MRCCTRLLSQCGNSHVWPTLINPHEFPTFMSWGTIGLLSNGQMRGRQCKDDARAMRGRCTYNVRRTREPNPGSQTEKGGDQR